jgi:hypothetical protein
MSAPDPGKLAQIRVPANGRIYEQKNVDIGVPINKFWRSMLYIHERFRI